MERVGGPGFERGDAPEVDSVVEFKLVNIFQQQALFY